MNKPSMYRTVMGDTFLRLANPVQQFHNFAGRHEFHGKVLVGAPASLPAKVLAILLGAPLKATEGAIRFALFSEPDTETWTRFFPDKTMRSTLTRTGNRITERLGAARLVFALLERDSALEMRLEKLYFLGVPCPAWLMPQLLARETGEGNELHFQIQVAVPVIGMVANYVGYLDMPNENIQ